MLDGAESAADFGRRSFMSSIISLMYIFMVRRIEDTTDKYFFLKEEHKLLHFLFELT